MAYKFISLVASFVMMATSASMAADNFAFNLKVSTGASSCISGASGRVTIKSLGDVETMHVELTGLPHKSDFDFFIIQVPNAPFGLAWYMGDISTDKNGVGVGDFIGRFSQETFIVAPGVAPAPVVFGGQFPDANANPKTAPVQIYHLGVWFNSPAEAAKAGCASTQTPFNGEHNAGIQALNTSNFPDNFGPLRHVGP